LRPFHSAAKDFASGTDSPAAFLERCLDTIAAQEPGIGAFAAMNVEGAKAAAAASTERWRANTPLSPIDGMPVGIKDIYETVDMPTGMGSPIFAGWQSNRDSAVVVALRESGAVILGKTVTTEFAATYPGGTRNPHDQRRTPGGSSSGSAAGVAAGFFSAGLGTQVMGSIIRPASFCGTYGFKPSLGALNRSGSHDGLSQSCAGALAASLEDAWNFCRAIAERAGGDPGYPGLVGPDALPGAKQPKALALLETEGWSTASGGAKAELARAAARLSAAGVAVFDRGNTPLVAEIESALEGASLLARRINAWEGRWPLNTYAAHHRTGLSAMSLNRLAEAEAMVPEDYRAAISVRAHIRESYARLAAIADGVVTLSALGAAPLGLSSTGDPVFAVPGSVLGVPAVSLPLLKDEGMPLGLQLLGFAGEDAALLGHAVFVRDLWGA
jgi:Asp-tRNA(Asn)/Glu-tRNA(Gln) amidotransferase A subunit family amidase